MMRSRITVAYAVVIMLCLGAVLLLVGMLAPGTQADSPEVTPLAESGPLRDSPYLVQTFGDPSSGNLIDEWVFPSGPRAIEGRSASGIETRAAGWTGDVLLPQVPAFDWCYGCSPTSAAMMFGYYDRTGYPNMYAGPANGGVCPLDNTVWGPGPTVGMGESPLSATHLGVDGLATNGSVDDYWAGSLVAWDPYFGNWSEHTYADCTADYMGTNQWNNWNNVGGSTSFFFFNNGSALCDFSMNESWPMGDPNRSRDGAHGMARFVNSRGYSVATGATIPPSGPNLSCNQYIQALNLSFGFSLAQYQAEIDAGRPVLIQLAGHTMIGYGYTSTNNSIDIHNTWNHTNCTMKWGGTYGNMSHIGVTTLLLDAPPATPTPTATG